MAHVAEWKPEEVKQLTDLLTTSKVVGIVEIGGIPAPQMQKMRKGLHGTASIRSAKNSLIFRALDDAEKQIKGISDLKELVSGQTAIITTDMAETYMTKKYQADKIALLGMLVASLLIARMLIAVRNNIILGFL